MGDLQVDLNAALVAVKQKCVDLDERVKVENENPQNRGRGYLGVKRYIYALTTRQNENSLNRRGRSLTRVYMEQKFYRSKSVPSPDQVQRLEDCTKDYGPNGEERLEFVETIDSPLDELIKEDQSHQQMVAQRLPVGHAEWDHEMAMFEDDGATGLLEDRTLMLRAGDHPFGMNQFNEAEQVSTRIAAFFGQKREESLIRTRELSLSVHPVYHQSNGDAYTSFGMTRSKSLSSVSHQTVAPQPKESRPRLEQIQKTTNSLSDLYHPQTRHEHHSRYGDYVSGAGRFGAPLPPPSNPQVMPKMPKPAPRAEETHIYDEPIVRGTSLHNLSTTTTTTTNVVESSSARNYERKYDFKSKFPPSVEMPEGYHAYYDPARFMFSGSQGYYSGNITRPLHYNYSQGYLETYSDYSRGNSPSPRPPAPEPEPKPEPIQYTVLQRTEDVPTCSTHLQFAFPDYYDAHTRIVLQRTEDVPHLELGRDFYFADYYDNAARIVLNYTRDLEHQEIQVVQFPDYYDLATRYPVLSRTEDVAHEPIAVQEYPAYKAYEVQELIETFDDEEPIYEEVYEPVLPVLRYHSDPDHVMFIPSAPYTPPPPPPPPQEEIFIATPVQVIEEAPPLPVEPVPVPVPTERHYDEIYVGQEALAVSVSPTFGQTTDHQKNLGLEKSVQDRVREMNEKMRGDDEARRREQERAEKFERLQIEIREARERELAEQEQQIAYNAYEEIEERKDTPAPMPQPILVPDVFVISEHVAVVPEKPKRTWQPPPKPLEFFDEHEDKPLGPVIFHELIYRDGILRRKFEEDHIAAASRPVCSPVSRAHSRPSTPGLELKSIDFPRLEEAASPRDHSDSAGNVDYVHERIERYNTYGAATQDSGHHHHQHHHHHQKTSHTPTEHVERYNAYGAETQGSHQHHHHHQKTSHTPTEHVERYNAYGAESHDSHHHVENSVSSHVHTVAHVEHHKHHHRGSVVYDEPSHEVLYDTPHDEVDASGVHHHHHHHHHHYHHDHDEHHHLETSVEHHQYQVAHAQANHAIRSMSKSNKWEEREHEHEHEHKHSTVLHHSNSLNRQNIPPPLKIQNGNRSSHSASHHDIHHHVHYDDQEDSENIQSSKSVTDLYSPVNVGHVKNLAKKFNKPDEKPITTEQVIYRVRAAPPGHHFQQEVKPRPRSLPRVPMDEVELHEHGEKDHLTRHHHEVHDRNGNGNVIGHKVEVVTNGTRHVTNSTVTKVHTHHNSHYHHQTDEPTIRVRRVYKALEDTSMLSPVSLPDGENMYDVPADARVH